MNSKILFFPLAIILTLVVIIWIIKPQWDEMKKNDQEIEGLTKERNKVQGDLGSLNKALENYESVDAGTKNIIKNVLPIAENGDDLVAEINTSAVRSGIFIENLGTQSRDPKASKCQRVQAAASKRGTSAEGETATKVVPYCPPQVGSMEVDLKVIGSYLAVKDFMGKLDAQNRLISPTGMRISKGKKVSGQDGENVPDQEGSVVSAKINFAVYYRSRDSKVALSRLSEENATLKQLLAGEIDKDTVEKIQKAVTSDYFRPVTVDGSGREDLFL